MRAFVGYPAQLFDARRAEPQDDLVGALLAAEDAGDALTEQELSSMVVLLIVAGRETTVGLIVNAVLGLLRHPDELARLRADRPSYRPHRGAAPLGRGRSSAR